MGKTDISVIDLKALSQPATKLIDAVARAIGVLYEPRRIRRKAKAEVDAALIRAEGRLQLRRLAVRASDRVNERELMRQRNIEAITSTALDSLPTSVSPDPVEEDWIIEFFGYCQDVSNETMQSLWARLLAREIARPRTFALRTLATVKTMSEEDANLFAKVCNYISKIDSKRKNRSSIGFIYSPDIWSIIAYDEVYFDSFIHLESLGLVNTGSGIQFIVSTELERHLTCADRKYKLTYNCAKAKVTVGSSGVEFYPLTPSGAELFALCQTEAKEDYLTVLRETLDEANIAMIPENAA